MKTALNILYRILSEGEDAVLATIVASDGSTPRKSGASMIITRAGRQYGTIGGGAVELKSVQMAQSLLDEKHSHLETFRLHPNEINDIGMICGGDNDVYFCYFDHEDEEKKTVLETAIEWWDGDIPSCWVMEINEEKNSGISILSKDTLVGRILPQGLLEGYNHVPECRIADKKRYFCRPLKDAGKVYIFGAGHIAGELAPLLVRLGFSCSVFDDREEYLNADHYKGIETVKIDPTDISEITANITEADYICIMTHGHKDDYEIQHQVMKTSARYIGVIGSARKQKTVKEKILALGFTEDDFQNVVSPIGLNIGANTPAEIAVCIAAQLIMVRAGRGFGERDWKR